MANAAAVVDNCNVNLSDEAGPVTVSLESEGVSSCSFRMDLVRGDTITKTIIEDGTEDDFGTEFSLGNAGDLGGLVLVTRGAAGAAVAGTVKLRNDFHFGGTVVSSEAAVIDITQNESSRPFRIRCAFQ